MATAKERNKNPTHGGYMSDQVFPRELMQPSEIRTFKPSCGIMVGRSHPVIFNKIVYHEEDLFLSRARLDPRYASEENTRVHREKKMARLIPDAETAISALEKAGYIIKKTPNRFGGAAFDVVWTDKNNKKTLPFASSDELVKWAREVLS